MDTYLAKEKSDCSVSWFLEEEEKKRQKMKACHVAKEGSSVWKSKVRNPRIRSTGFAIMAEAQCTSPSQPTFTSKSDRLETHVDRRCALKYAVGL
jgi:hypothetical protein